MKVVLDCANGAAYKVAPQVLWELGAEVISIGTAPDGTNINLGCGSTHPRNCAAKVIETGADLGITLDGDADRSILIDENGQIADGDQIMALFAAHWAESGKLRDGVLVSTVMSNLGLERFLEGRGLRLERTPVGDRHVVERMRQGGWNLGGEQSGHIVMSDYATTGDGLFAALQFIATMVESGKPASKLARNFEPAPQMLRNLRYASGVDLLSKSEVQKVVEAGHLGLQGRGRLLIRKSGTEPLVRFMAECEDEDLMVAVLDDVIGTMEAAS